MPDPQQKLVKVPDLGVVQFPAHMDDDSILKVIRKHNGKAHEKSPLASGIATEGSEHLRQLKDAQPLSSALPKVPEWASKPLLPKVMEPAGKAMHKVDDYLSGRTPQQGEAFRAQGQKNVEAAEKKYPVIAGVNAGVGDFVNSMSSPVNLGLAVAAPESKALSALFSIQAINGTFKDAQKAREAYLAGNNKEAARYATSAAFGGATALAAGSHAYSGLPEGVRTRLADEEGSLTYHAADKDQPFFLKSENLIGQKMKGPMPGEDLHKMLLSNGVKPEEMKWTGLDEFLKSKGKQKVTPEEMQQHIANNDIQIKEVTKGAGHGAKTKDQWATEEYNKPYAQLDPYQQRYVDSMVKVDPAAREDKTKFGSYVLPGGENYREMLLTVPNIGRDQTYQRLVEDYRKAEQESYDYMDSHKQNLSAPDPAMRSVFDKVKSTKSALDEYKAKKDKESPEGVYRPSQNDFSSSHWDEPNILGHVRFNDRTGPNGEKILHLEELQSDWGQKGRQHGYKGKNLEEDLKKANDEEENATSAMQSARTEAVKYLKSQSPDISPVHVRTILDHVPSPEQMKQIESESPVMAAFYKAEAAHGDAARRAIELADKQRQGVPEMPFAKDWHELLMKRMMRYAAQNGYDGISWTPGEAQAERYDLSKQISELRYSPEDKKLYAQKQGSESWEPAVKYDVRSPEDLPNLVGKEAAQKLIEKPKNNAGYHILSGLDLKVGGEGMKGFYDKIIPDTANKIGKQWGAKVGETEIQTEAPPEPEWESVNKSDLPEGFASAYEWHYESKNGYKSAVGIYEGENGDWWAYKDGNELVSEVPKEQALHTAIEAANEDIQGEATTKSVPYIPITPEMRKGITGSVQSLFGSGSTPMTPQQVLELSKKIFPSK